METLPRITLSRAEMMKRVARFKDLKGSDGGLPDSKMPGCERTLYNVIGFQPPKGKGGAVTSPVGDDAARLAAIKISEGFNLGYCRAKPGHGPMMHIFSRGDPKRPKPSHLSPPIYPIYLDFSALVPFGAGDRSGSRETKSQGARARPRHGRPAGSPFP